MGVELDRKRARRRKWKALMLTREEDVAKGESCHPPCSAVGEAGPYDRSRREKDWNDSGRG